MKVLVTGGAGYVGSFCVRRLIDAGHQVTVFDSLVAGHLKAVPQGAPLVHGDLADTQLVRLTLQKGFDAVMHFAAFLDVGESVRTPLKYYQNNVANTIHLLQAMQDAGVKKFVFSSTCATYGVPDKVPIVEQTPQSPINPYGHTKLAMEWALADCCAAWGLGACALRYFNAAGAASDGAGGEDHHPEIHLIPIVMQVALAQRDKISIFGTDYPTPDGTCVRDYIHVEDLAQAHLLALQQLKDGVFDAYNVGTGTGTSVRELIEAARAVTKHAIPAQESPRRPGDPPQLLADPAKIKTHLGWKPKYVEIGSILETAWRWHRDHPNGYNDRS